MKEETKDNAAVLAAYEIAAEKAEHMARKGTFAISAVTDWEDHRQDAALAIARKKGAPQDYLTATGLRALKYNHAAALRDKYGQMQRPQPNAKGDAHDEDNPDESDDAEATSEQPARPGSWMRWRRARFTLEETAPALSWRAIKTLAALLAEDMDFDAAAKRLGVHRATAYRMFLRAASEFRHKCPFRY